MTSLERIERIAIRRAELAELRSFMLGMQQQVADCCGAAAETPVHR